MAPTIKWQRWDSASYDWFGVTAADALPSLEAELDAWITVVNGNASNVGRQVTKERGYAASTATTTHAGLVISCGAASNSAKGYLQYISTTSTNKRIATGPTYADDTSNSGYGTVSGGKEDTAVAWYTSGVEASWLLSTSVVDGQEYFIFGPAFPADSSSREEGFTIFKCSDGEWSLVANDGTNQAHTHYWDSSYSTGWSNCSRSVGSNDSSPLQVSDSAARYGLRASIGSNLSIVGVPSAVYAANADLMTGNGTGTYNRTGTRMVYTDLGDGDNVYLYSAYVYGPAVLVDLRP